MEKITTYYEGGRRFYILKDSRGYWGIEDKYFDETGKLAKEFNGISGNFSVSVEETIQRVIDTIRVDALVEDGFSRMEAAIIYFGGAEAWFRYRELKVNGKI